jgi:radical SAM-linked protein
MSIEKFPITAAFKKTGEMVHFSQLDLTHVLERALRRTDLPLYFTKGFNPRVKLSFSAALKVGIAGQITVTMYFTRPVARPELAQALSPQLPDGLAIREQEFPT